MLVGAAAVEEDERALGLAGGRALADDHRARARQRRQPRLDLRAQVLEVRRQRQLLAERLERLVGGEAGAERRDLEQDAARLAEVDRAEAEAVDHRRRPPAGGRDLLAASLVLVERRRPTRRGAPSRRPGCRAAVRRRRRRRRSRRAARRARLPARLEAEPLEERRAARRVRGVGAHAGEAAERVLLRDLGMLARRAARRPSRRRPARARAPPGRAEDEPSRRSPPDALGPEVERRPRSRRGTTTRCTIPSPARPGGAPGYSKNVMSAPAEPFSSA